MRPCYLPALALASLTLLACSNDGDTAIESCQTFRTALSIKDRMSQGVNVFISGEPITFELETSNRSNAPATLTAGSSCTAVVFDVLDSAQQRRWGSADGIACIQMLQPRTFAPQETVVESSTWEQKDSGGGQVPPGTYTVSANVGQYASDADGRMVDCRAQLSKSATLTIQ